MRIANSRTASFMTSLYGRASRGFSRIVCAIAENFPKALPKLLHFTILFSLAGFSPSVYAGNYVPGSCGYRTSTPQDYCEKIMHARSKAYLTTLNGTQQLFDCSGPQPECPYPNVDLSPGNVSCWSFNQLGWSAACTITACPAHASGTPCVCDPGYKFDDAGTSCVPDQETYTLALTPESATIEPGKTYSFTATVTKQGGGAPSKPVPVSVKVEVDPISGGHDGTHTSPRPKGSVSPATGTNSFPITFSSTEVSGTHTITATCDLCSNSTKTATVNVKVKEADAAGWDSLDASPSDYELVGGGEGRSHHDNHYLTETARDHLQSIVEAYNKAYPVGPVLYLNDASLEWGGKFDISGKWSGDHYEHLRGKEIDIRANQEPTAISFWRFNRFKKIASDNGASASMHCSFPKAYSWACWFDMGKNRHFHVRLTSK